MQSLTSAPPALPIKTPMALAASLLSDLCERVDAGEDPTDSLIAAFSDVRVALADSVDRRIAFDRWISGQIATAKTVRDEWAAEVKKLARLQERFEENTITTVVDNPGIPFEGRLGKIAVQNNAPSLELDAACKGELDTATIALLKIPKKWIKKTVSVRLDSAAVKAFLVGEPDEKKWPAWASLSVGKQVRFKK